MRSSVLFAGTALALLAACHGAHESGVTAQKTAAAVTDGKLALPFIENDLPAALARAREANLPLFVEVWAPW